MKKIEDVHILVVGDMMLDEYVVGKVERISPEAPVQIVDVTDEYYELGGAANVVNNIASIGAKVSTVLFRGNDTAGEILEDKLSEICHNILTYIDPTRRTTIKTRVVSELRHSQLLRIDRESRHDCEIDPYLDYEGDEPDIIIVSDYNKGIITPLFMERIRELNCPIIVDPKPQNIRYYHDVFMITPNKKEYEQIGGKFPDGIKFILETCGKDGMKLFSAGSPRETIIPSRERTVYNVSGAGDVAISTLAVCIAMEVDIYNSVAICNDCAGLSVEKPGTSVVTRREFEEELKRERRWVPYPN